MFSIKTRQWQKKLVVLLLSFIVVLTYMPSEAFAGIEWHTGMRGYFKEGDTLKGSDNNQKGNSYFYHDSSLYTNRWPSADGTKWLKENCYSVQTPCHSYILKPKDGSKGKEAYCLEQNVRNPEVGNVTYKAETWEESPFIGNLYSDSVQRESAWRCFTASNQIQR